MPARPHQPIITTARTKSHMSDADIAALHQAMAPYTPSKDWLTHPPQPLEVELGIGNGLALLQRAKNNPTTHHLGAEVFLNGLQKLVQTIGPTPVPNLHLMAADGRTLLQQLPPGSTQRLLVLHPDPWPKTRHHKRRLINPTFLQQAAHVLQPHGELWVVTDWPDYAFHTLHQLYGHAQFQLAQTDQAAHRCKTNPKQPSPQAAQLGPQHLATPPAWWVPTKYGQKAQKLGRNPWFICAIKKP